VPPNPTPDLHAFTNVAQHEAKQEEEHKEAEEGGQGQGQAEVEVPQAELEGEGPEVEETKEEAMEGRSLSLKKHDGGCGEWLDGRRCVCVVRRQQPWPRH
jgi:hypothetical protein